MPCLLISTMMRKISSTRMGLSPIDGSSRSSRVGLLMRPRAVASICCSPPESVPPYCPAALLEPREALVDALEGLLDLRGVAARVGAHHEVLPARTAARRSCGPSGTWLMPSRTIFSAGMVVMSCPLNVIEPVRERRRPEMVRRVVDLPAPLAPISVTISPSFTLKETPWSAWIAP